MTYVISHRHDCLEPQALALRGQPQLWHVIASHMPRYSASLPASLTTEHIHRQLNKRVGSTRFLHSRASAMGPLEAAPPTDAPSRSKEIRS